MLPHPETLYQALHRPSDYDRSLRAARQYALREALRERRHRNRGGSTERAARLLRRLTA